MANIDNQSAHSRYRDQQDMLERHVWGDLEYVDGAGAVMRVTGTDTTDEQVALMNTGYGFNLEPDTDAEVMLLAMGADTNQKVAIPTIPRDKQRKWARGAGGVQHPTRPDIALEFDPDGGVRLISGELRLGMDSRIRITVSGDQVVIHGNIRIEGDLQVNGQVMEHNGVNVGHDHRHGGVRTGGGSTDGPY